MNQQDLVWVSVPFSDFSDAKIRPALIVSNDTYGTHSEDVLICAVTSSVAEVPYSLPLKQTDLVSGTLAVPSRIKADKLLSVSKKLVLRPFARISDPKFDEVVKQIVQLVSRNDALRKEKKQ
ncbi:MAG: type II toxin-antitoxin system PemK/MazF family toxin [Candidatus Diapherotrites archaeon]|nr:type II toxin-antitoxin system PemK/MazF family toxin [Candidatus Diapherotrites archaeon]